MQLQHSSLVAGGGISLSLAIAAMQTAAKVTAVWSHQRAAWKLRKTHGLVVVYLLFMAAE